MNTWELIQKQAILRLTILCIQEGIFRKAIVRWDGPMTIFLIYPSDTDELFIFQPLKKASPSSSEAGLRLVSFKGK